MIVRSYPIGIGSEEEVRGWPKGWFRDGQPWLRYPSVSNLRWLRHAGIDLPDEYRRLAQHGFDLAAYLGSQQLGART